MLGAIDFFEGGFWFENEFSDPIGPYPLWEDAEEAAEKYIARLNGWLVEE